MSLTEISLSDWFTAQEALRLLFVRKSLESGRAQFSEFVTSDSRWMLPTSDPKALVNGVRAA